MTWQFLTDSQYDRLANCKSKKADLCNIAKCYMAEKQTDPETALIYALEHLGCNNQFIDLSPKEDAEIIRRLTAFKKTLKNL